MTAPVFVGGTGRSGTTVTARLLGAHSAITEVPFEARFPTDADGVPALVSGAVSMEEFAQTMWRRWFVALYTPPHPPTGGLDRLLTERQVQAALDRLQDTFEHDPHRAARDLINDLLDPLAHSTGTERWVEASPRNAMSAGFLVRLFPDLKMLVCIRDGRDVARSFVDLGWLPDMTSALRWWENRTRQSSRGLAGLSEAQRIDFHFEDLAANDRDATYQRLLEFLGLEREPAIDAFFAERLTAAGANLGRWHVGLDSAERAGVDRYYGELLDGLIRDRVGMLPRH